MALNQESGGDNNSRAIEALRIVKMLEDHSEELDSRESDFYTNIADRLEQYGDKTFVSPKQLFWLRDLKDRYCL